MIAEEVKTLVASDSVIEINGLHKELVGIEKTALDLAKTWLERAVRIGDLLTANKAAVDYGDWLNWLKKNIVFSDQTARNYMRIYENRDDPRFKTVLNLADAYKLLANKTVRQAARANRKPIDDFGGETTPVAAAVINEVGGITSETAAKASGRHKGNGALWDGKPALSHVRHFKIYNPKSGQMPDVAAQVLHDLDLISEPDAGKMFGAVERESRSARTAASEERIQARLAAAAEKRAAIEALPEVQAFNQFLATQSKRDAQAIVAVLACRWGIIIDSESKPTVAELDSIDDADRPEVQPKSPLIEELI
jgi:hypothetical protein